MLFKFMLGYLIIINYLHISYSIQITTPASITSKSKASSSNANKFIKQPENTTLVVGKRLLLRCKPNLTNYIKNLNEKNINLIQYQWFKDSQPINYSSKMNLYKDGSFEITQVNEKDIGYYSCIARYRTLIYESQKAYVNVLPESATIKPSIGTISTTRPKTPPKFLLWPEDRSVAEDDEVIFECLAFNDASLFSEFNSSFNIETSLQQYYKYKWLKDGVPLELKSSSKNRNKRYQLVQGFNLRIEKLQESDTGTYTCRICNLNDDSNNIKKQEGNMNTDGESVYDEKNSDSSDLNLDKEECDERSSTLKVLVPPRFIKRPSNLNVTLKSDAELECSAFGVPTPTIQWFKNGEPIYPSDYFQFNSNQGNLKILGIISQDEGYYQCLASNELNTIQSVAQLMVQSEDYSSDSQDYYDSDLTFSSFNKPNGKTNKTKKTTSTSATSLLTQTKQKQSGSQNKQNLATTTSPPSVVHLSAPIGLRVVKSKSRSLHIEWQQPSIVRNIQFSTKSSQNNADSDSDKLLYYAVNWKPKNMDRQREINTTRNSIVIEELTPDTVYLIQICAMIASKKGPYSFLEAKTEVEATLPGAPIDFKAELIDLNSSSQTSSSPTLKFKWKKPLVNSNNIIRYRLYYHHLHYGPANNPISSDEQSEEKESSNGFGNQFYPSNKDEDYVGGDELILDEDGERRKSKAQEKYLDIEIPSELEGASNDYYYEFLLEDLLKYSTYKFRLIAVDKESQKKVLKEKTTSDEESDSQESSNENDKSYFNYNSAEIVIETPSDVPDGPPENIQIETLNTTSILVQWNLPSIEKRNGIIVGYKIAVKENDKQVWNSNVDSEPRRKIISGLLPGHKYSVRITAKTVNGSGPASEWFIAETFSHEMDESKVPDQPVDLFAEPTDKSIVIHWSSPTNSNKTLIRKYLLRYGTTPDNEVYIELPGNQNSYIINNLIPSSQYILSLKAVNNAGFGKEILKDVITKRKSALNENENLFPPLNVHATALSSESIQIGWTDWHLKPDESIPDERYYSVRYNIETSNAKYKFKNASERNIIISDLKPNTLYDFSVKLIIGRRESDWSMTTSQMTMELSPAPHNITIKSDPKTPSSVLLTWLAPSNSPSNGDLPASKTGYVISYVDESTFKENTNNKWKHEQVASNNNQQLQQHTIKKLKLETVYYFKIQARNNRAYGAASPTIKYKTANSNGEGGGKIFIPSEYERASSLDTSIVMNTAEFIPSASSLKLKEISIIAGISLSFIVLIIILVGVFKSKSSKKKTNNSQMLPHGQIKSLNRNGGLGASKRVKKATIDSPDYDNAPDLDEDDEFQKQTVQQQQQQQLLMCNNTNKNEMSTHLNCTSNTSTLMKHHANRTPSHHQALVINNPNHMMMNPLSINYNSNASNNNHSNLTDVEFYSNMTTQQLFTNNSHVNSDSGYNHHNNDNYNSFSQQNQNFNYYNQQQQQHQNQFGGRFGDENNLNDEMSNEAALAAANAAFNSPFMGCNTNANLIATSTINSQSNEPSFLRHTIRPKPIAIPLNTTSMTNQSNSLIGDNQSVFSMSNSARKSFKNLPIATATLISSSNTANNNFNFNDNQMKPTQKLHYTARPYIIDNQVQSGGEYSNNSTHSPASSTHSSQPPVYDKIGNIIVNSNASTKSLLQPLKSFGTNQNNCNTVNSMPPSSLSIPNTPAKYCDNLNSNFVNMTRSPAKKQLLVSLGSSTNTSTSISRVNNYGQTNKSSDILMMMGKSVENVYDKKLSNGGGEELTAEMANLEGIMKDLNAITATQFEC